ncbi:MAG TPA: hypothetical protein VMY69_09835 [Phycisphaerae bacterium]|nr:hypothetical protein [Phycisphaerae bacterium]
MDRSPEVGAAWARLAAAWCGWLLVWLMPSLLLSPRVMTMRLWLTREAAPAAVVIAAALFLAVVWPFWPWRGRSAPEAEERFGIRRLGRWVLEAVVLAVLAVPFVLAAWSVGGRTPSVGRLAAAFGILAVFGLGLRTAAGGLGRSAAKWLMLAAVLVCAGPILLEYAAGETMGIGFPRFVETSPVVVAVRVALEPWPEETWLWLVRTVLWPAVGVLLGIAGFWVSSRRGEVSP